MKKINTLIVANLILLLSLNFTYAQTVTSGADSGLGSLRQEIANAAPGTTISISPLVITINLNSEIVLNKDLTIDGFSGITTIDAGMNGRIFNITSNTIVLNDLILTNGLADNGGAIILENANLTINNSELINNTANGTPGSGGAIFNGVGATLVVNNSVISGNVANRAGGGIEDQSGAGLGIILNNVNLDNNNAGVAPATAAPGNGGGLHITGAGNSSIIGGTANNNIAALEGGALWNGSGAMSVDGTIIRGNIASGAAANEGGGGIFNNGGTLTIVDAIINSNVADGAAGSGGGILNDMGILTVTTSTLDSNSAVRAGGGIEVASGMTSNLILVNTDFSYNETGAAPGNGGGLHITGSSNSNITGGNVTFNTASSEGGGFWNGTGSMTINGTIFTSNTASGALLDQGGGALFNAGGSLIVANVAMSNNVADGTAGSGGAILNDLGNLTISTSTLNVNTASRAGGGIEHNSVATSILDISDVNFIDNIAASAPGNGGGLHISGAGNSSISGGIVTGNIAALEGGGFWNGTGIMTVDSITISNNIASGAAANEGGGALFNAGGSLFVFNSSINNNIADGAAGSGGGILNDLGSLQVTNTNFDENSAVRAGGAIEQNSVANDTLVLLNVTMINNLASAAPGNGGGLHISGPGDAVITNGLARNNTAAREGGALWNSIGTMTIINMEIDSNFALGAAADDGGAGIFNNGGNLNILDGTIVSNNIASGTSGSGGGLLSTDGNVLIESVIFEANSANRAGGAIEIINGDLTIENAELINNDVNGNAGTAAPGNGGALHISGMASTININNTFVDGNEAAREGGGLWNQLGSTMNVSYSTISNNESFGTTIDNGGAGIYNSGGVMNINNSTISNNDASGAASAGGGIHNKPNGVISVVLTTISSNNSNGDGGGIYNFGDSIYINASTIANNQSALEGGGLNSQSPLVITNTLIAGNMASSGSDISGMFTSTGFNLIAIDDLNIFTPLSNDIENVSPDLGPLQNNGGTTFTHELLSGSAGINAGNPSETINDQIDQTLVATRDIGAFENQTPVGIRDKKSNLNAFIYPNPTQNVINIEISNEVKGNIQADLYDITGSLIKSELLLNGSNKILVNNLFSGIYLLNINNVDAVSSHKVIIK